jgi:pSer/pThr/pTyr-binding forkhead associated (FHA) protein
MPTLQLILGPLRGTSIALAKDRVVIGRELSCDILLEGRAVSKLHAIISKVEGSYYIEDCASRNGTHLNNERLTTRALLAEGDVINICDHRLQFGDRALSY